ncbi:hypothetical protein Bca52824_057643 [Brassica carinata]|uniref:Uncharacterized protein n=1 Tax=Brassica carinata TaxID=52824 RepID=A0A8X7QWG7_BRACI|nr:hypothetical protein Bca52824_057643 [Brassica carinata]
MIVSNLKLVVFSNPNREDLGKALRDWNLWGPFFFIVFLGLTLSWSASVKKAKASLDSALLLAFDLTQRTDSVSNKQHNVVLSYTYKKWGEMARKICLDDVEVKLGELEAEIFRPYNELVEFRYPRNCSYTDKSFLGSFSGHIESGRDPENYLKYSVQDIERIVLDFFEEYTHVTPAKLEKTMKEEDWRGYFLSFVLFWFPSHVSML